MKKRVWAVFVLAALLTLGTSTMTALAAEGWAEQNGSWVYLNNNGDRLYNVWRKGADGYWRYLDGNGVMATNSWVDDIYFVDDNGIMVENKWYKMLSDDTSTNEIDKYDWYYFNEYGKAATDAWRKINDKWYYFDDDHKMLTGWILNDMYYCDENGVMLTGWQRLFPPNEDDDDYGMSPSAESDDGKEWYYFQASGKKVAPSETSDGYKELKINGKYYCFDSDGALATGWVNMNGDDDNTASINEYRYLNDDGTVRTGWYSLEPPEALSGNYEHAVEWFYFTSNGIPRCASQSGRLSSKDIYKIGKYNYLFNEYGVPAYGLHKVYIGETENYTAYYLGERSESCVMTGKQKVTEDDGNQSTFYFMANGRGFTGVHDHYLYYMGKPQKADSGVKYEVFSFPTNSGKYTNYVVNSSGKLARNTTVKNGDGVKYKTNSSGILIEVDGEPAGDGEFTTPVEPVWAEN